MNFFNKYKDLFGVPNNTPIPQSKLSVNNNLFIDKPFVPTYQQTLSINSKLRDLRKDYNELQQQLQSINMVMKTPKRVPSRKGKQLQQTKQKDKILNVNNSPIPAASSTPKNTRFLKHDRRATSNQQNNANFRSLQGPRQPPNQMQIKDPFSNKRMTWLKDEQVNLNKHSQLDYIFNHKIKQQNEKTTKNISEMQMPKAQNFMFGITNNDNNNNNNVNTNSPIKIGLRGDTFKPTNRNRMAQNTNINSVQSFQGTNKRRQSNKGELDYNGAIRRREQAKKNIKVRRQKLGYLYRTTW